MWLPLFLHSGARGIKGWYPVAFQAVRASRWGLLSWVVGEFNGGGADKGTFPPSQDQAPVAWDTVAFVPLGWGWRSLLLWHGPDLVLHCGRILRAFKEICTQLAVQKTKYVTCFFSWRESVTFHFGIFTQGFSLWFIITSLCMVVVPPDPGDWRLLVPGAQFQESVII